MSALLLPVPRHCWHGWGLDVEVNRHGVVMYGCTVCDSPVVVTKTTVSESYYCPVCNRTLGVLEKCHLKLWSQYSEAARAAYKAAVGES